jgi:hypothetical protein
LFVKGDGAAREHRPIVAWGCRDLHLPADAQQLRRQCQLTLATASRATVTTSDAVFPSTVAVIVDVPSDTAVTSPVVLTEAAALDAEYVMTPADRRAVSRHERQDDLTECRWGARSRRVELPCRPGR